MRLLRVAVLILPIFVVGCGGTPKTQSADKANSQVALAADVERVAERLANEDKFSGVVLLTQNGQTLVRRAFGMADRASNRTNTPETAFALASIGKMFTAVVVARLAERMQIAFDSPIGTLLPNYPAVPARSQVTVQHLLTMSSGIPDVFKSQEFFAGLARVRKQSDFWPYFANAPLEFQPGTKWTYSNSNFLVLGAIVERVTGKPFPSEVEDQIFRPVGMTHTTYYVSKFPDAALGYTHSPPAGTPIAPDRWYPAWKSPAAKSDRTNDDQADGCVVCSPLGGGISTADDLTHFAEALMQGRLLGQDMTQRVMKGIVQADYGGRDALGFETLLLNGVRIVGHRGGFPGITNQMEFYPDLGYVLVILGNSDAGGTEAITKRVRTLIADPSGSAIPAN
jgi:CubicO group peptidase (beta-lactamase class C family)